LCASERATEIATLNRQRLLTPSCGSCWGLEVDALASNERYKEPAALTA
jgi:hypothetical protein